MAADTTKLVNAQRWLVILWLLGAAFPFAAIFLQTTVGNAFASGGTDQSTRVWEWFLPTVVPTLGLVVGVVANNELRESARRLAERRRVSSFFFRITFGISSFYLLLVGLLPILTAAKSTAEDKLMLLGKSHLFLPPVQAIAATALAVFFIGADGAAPTTQTSPATGSAGT